MNYSLVSFTTFTSPYHSSHSLGMTFSDPQLNLVGYIRASLHVHLALHTSMFLSFVQLLSQVWLFVIPWTAAQQAPLSYTISRSLLKFMSIESVMLSNHFVPCHSLLLLSSIFPSIKVFSNESDLLIRWPKYWSFSFSISPSNEYSGLISTSIDWFDFLAVQGTPQSLI